MNGDTNIGTDWRQTFRAFTRGPVVAMLFLGFSAGLPLLLIFSTLSLWLNDAGLKKSLITYFSWAALGYSFKFVWAPLIDRMPLPLLSTLLGRRRSWLLVAQLAVTAAIVWMALTDPASHLSSMAFAAVALGFSSATQDIVIDAYRIEAADSDLQALMSSSYIAGYRLGMLVAGAGALKLAAWLGADGGGYNYVAWQQTYLLMAAVMLVGMVTTLLIPEPVASTRFANDWSRRDYLRFLLLFLLIATAFVAVFASLTPIVATIKDWLLSYAITNSRLAGFFAETLRLAASIALAWLVAWLAIGAGVARREMLDNAYLDPLRDFIHRYGKQALLLLALIASYRVSDIVLGVIANVFYQDLGFSKDEIADITKVFGLMMTLLGGFLGGILAVRYGVIRILFLGGLLSALTNLLFVLLAHSGHDPAMLILVVSMDNISAAIASAAFVAYLSSLTQVAYTATQYAIFSSLMTLLPKILGGYSGTMVESMGYSSFFVLTTLLGAPVLLLIWLVIRRQQASSDGRLH